MYLFHLQLHIFIQTHNSPWVDASPSTQFMKEMCTFTEASAVHSAAEAVHPGAAACCSYPASAWWWSPSNGTFLHHMYRWKTCIWWSRISHHSQNWGAEPISQQSSLHHLAACNHHLQLQYLSNTKVLFKTITGEFLCLSYSKENKLAK